MKAMIDHRMRGILPPLVLLAHAAVTVAQPAPRLSVGPAEELFRHWGASYTATMVSQALGQERRIHVFVPESFKATERKYPIIFSGDGEYDYERLVIAARQLSTAGYIPECIVVAVDTPERRNDMTPQAMGNENSDGDARAEKFLTFLARELRPEIESKFRGSSPSVLLGHSHGGILGHYAAAERRKDFPFIVALDAPVNVQDRWLERTLAASIPGGGPLRLVSMEVRFGWRDEEWARLAASAPKNWKLIRAAMPDDDHEMMFFGGAFAGLELVFGDYSAAKPTVAASLLI